MTPFESALADYMTRFGYNEGRKRFYAEMKAHLITGYVHNTPETFFVFRAVVKGHPMVGNPHASFTEPDAWFIWFAAGNMFVLWNYMPEWLPFIGWARRNGSCRFYKTEKLRKKCTTNPMFIPAVLSNNNS